MCRGNTFGFTAYGGLRSITFCPLAFEYPSRKHSLSEWRSGKRVIADGKNMQAALSTPGTFLHELMHMLNGAGKLEFLWSE
jgi:hypothetical protein